MRAYMSHNSFPPMYPLASLSMQWFVQKADTSCSIHYTTINTTSEPLKLRETDFSIIDRESNAPLYSTFLHSASLSFGICTSLASLVSCMNGDKDRENNANTDVLMEICV